LRHIEIPISIEDFSAGKTELVFGSAQGGRQPGHFFIDAMAEPLHLAFETGSTLPAIAHYSPLARSDECREGR